MLKIGSLFSGYGGLDLAVMDTLGAEVVWHCEWDDAPSKILDKHWPDVPNYRDVSQVDWASIEPVDILTGGFPCQDVSLAGARRGLAEGTRSGLWSEFAKAIGILRPRLVVIENVRGLLSASAAVGELEYCAWCVGDEPGEPALRALGAVLGSLADLGYDAEWCGVRAADAGAPHGRFRVFITAWPSEYSYPDGDGFESGGGYSRTVTKSQPYRGLGLVTWADRAAENNFDLLRTPVADETGGGMTSPAMAKHKGQTLRLSGQIVDLVEPGRLPQPNLPTPTTRDYKDTSVTVAKHRPNDKDTLSRALAHLENDE